MTSVSTIEENLADFGAAGGTRFEEIDAGMELAGKDPYFVSGSQQGFLALDRNQGNSIHRRVGMD